MYKGHIVAVVIPAINEGESIGKVIGEIPAWVDDIVVGDNGSTDATQSAATSAGARVVEEPKRGYGSACLKALAALNEPDIVVFLDGDYSDYPEEMDSLIAPIVAGDAEVVIGSRVLGKKEKGALTPQARFGNWLATRLIRLIWKVRYTDLGPFRAIRYTTLQSLDMQDPDYGWTVELQIKAAVQGVRGIEVPVRYRKRVGRSKVSGTVRGVVGAGIKILGWIGVAALFSRPKPRTKVVLFTRYPEPGKTKTRMIPVLGEEGAAKLQRDMTEYCVAHNVPPSMTLEVRYAGGAREAMRAWLGGNKDYAVQGEGDLGLRMATAFTENFAQGFTKVIHMGADCPGIGTARVEEAARLLDECDVVIGPASDGGYYLIGVHQGMADKMEILLSDTDWGTETVRATTLQHAQSLGLRVMALDVLDDVDRPEDLKVWERFTQSR